MNSNILEGTFNFRDLGGYSNREGKVVVRNKVFRADSLDSLTEKDINTLNKMELRTIVDLRQKTETDNFNPIAPLAELSTGNITNDREKIDRLLRVVNEEQEWNKINENKNSMGKQMLEMAFSEYSVLQFNKIFKLLLKEQSVPLLFHCKGGKDRTGLMAALFLMSLSVEKEVIIDDYLKTKENMKNRNKLRMDEYRKYTSNERILDFLYSLMDTKVEYIEIVLDAIEDQYDTYENYLIDVVKLLPEEIQNLKEIYLETE